MGGFGGFLEKFAPAGKKLIKTIKGGKGGKGGDDGPSAADDMGAETSGVPSFKKGGKVRKTGLARLHKGERVLNKRQTKRYNKKRG